MLLTVVQQQSICHLGEAPTKVTQFQLFCFCSIFDYNYLYSTYADDTNFFLKYIVSIKHMVDILIFFVLFELRRNLTKSEITGIGVLKEVQVAVCGMRCIYLNSNMLKH